MLHRMPTTSEEDTEIMWEETDDDAAIDFGDLTMDEMEPYGMDTNNRQQTETSAPPIFTVTLDTEVGNWVDYDRETGEPIGRGRTIADLIVCQTVAALTSKLREEVCKVIREEAKRQIGEQVRDLIAEVITNPVQLTNRFGEPSGNTVTVREHIENEVKDQLTQRVDDWNRKGSVLTQIIKTEVEQALAKELRQAAVDARNVVVGAVKSQASTMLAKALKDGLRD